MSTLMAQFVTFYKKLSYKLDKIFTHKSIFTINSKC